MPFITPTCDLDHKRVVAKPFGNPQRPTESSGEEYVGTGQLTNHMIAAQLHLNCHGQTTDSLPDLLGLRVREV